MKGGKGMNVKYDFSGKTAVVTGAASGIGEGIALAFAESGASVAILDINMEKGQETAAACEKLGVKAKAFLADITSEESLQSAREGVLETFGTVDFLISHAGVAKVPGLKTNPFTPPIKNLPLEHWEILMDYNLFGAVRVTNAFLDILKDKKDGKVVYTASVAGLKAGSKKPHYHAAKSALINFSKSVAQECGPFNVNVNVVNPGWVYTPIYENLIDVVKNPAWGDAYKDCKTSQEALDVMAKSLGTFLQRSQSVESTAQAYLWLCSDGARELTGQTINVDSGWIV